VNEPELSRESGDASANPALRLTSAQMSRMNRLLDEVLPLDEAGRRHWLDGLAREHQDIAEALRSRRGHQSSGR
jgi:DNA-binding FadR family transcriptional regulator